MAATLGALALMAGTAATSGAADVPPYFGSDHDNPRTADRPIAKPNTKSCTSRIVDHGFRDFNVYTSAFTPPAQCAGDWSKVVLTMHGAVKGRQYDRLGWLKVGGVPVFKTSTPEPSADGIEWSVERDVTDYATLLRSPQEVQMSIGNVVDDTYTGVLDVTVDLTFYGTSARWPAAKGAEQVQPLADPTGGAGDTHGTLTIKPNTERLVADVYATGSGGGCEEFWYTAAPTKSPDDYWCKTDQGPWRELQVYVDGRLAGIATPYPHIYTGGWSNPFLWYVLPAPRAFDIKPVQLDLTPFVASMTDGKAHQVSIKVDGAAGGGWDVPVAFRSWQDEHSTRVTGTVRAPQQTTPAVSNTTGQDGAYFTADLNGRHGLTTTGTLNTSHGPVTTTVHREVAQKTHHYWADGETTDGQSTTMTDTGFVRTAAGRGPATYAPWSFGYDLTGRIDTTTAGDITTDIKVTDRGNQLVARGPSRGAWTSWDNAYAGRATWNYIVPREERRATGTSSQDFSTRASDGCWHGQIATQNGVVTREGSKTRC
ncbi:hypothetical protein VV02_17655 [Luteipulveratus mongoliensis]|uniref:Peptide N-acetyl-beta-D-glucosaminyl asparaginase amidase A N-terminal domain-containing protein n=2 Tax=Luteipulveratus mongoliensis TaxID=571913 RepID=A0A0K1JKK7_9MICO|nr:hypothetical protein VV02_17655 [Luteipulveratus mongoliensis]